MCLGEVAIHDAQAPLGVALAAAVAAAAPAEPLTLEALFEGDALWLRNPEGIVWLPGGDVVL